MFLVSSDKYLGLHFHYTDFGLYTVKMRLNVFSNRISSIAPESAFLQFSKESF